MRGFDRVADALAQGAREVETVAAGVGQRLLICAPDRPCRRTEQCGYHDRNSAVNPIDKIERLLASPLRCLLFWFIHPRNRV
jgi:hypothetical protein